MFCSKQLIQRATAPTDMEEAYTVMSPAGVLCRSLNSGQVEPISLV